MDLLEILFLICCWPVEPDHLPPVADPVTWQNLKTAAKLLDLWDGEGWAEDVQYGSGSGANFTSDLLWCWRTHGTHRHLPPSADVWRFPTAEAADAALAFNQQHIDWLDGQRTWWLLRNEEQVNPVIEDALSEAWRLRYPWQTARCLHSCTNQSNRSLFVVREYLGNLRFTIGDDAYYSGRMPPWVPVERFTWIR